MFPQPIKTYLGYLTLLSLLLSGLVLNVVQLVVFIIVRPFNKHLYRELNHYLQYGYWSQSVAVADWNSNLKCRLYYKDERSAQEFGSTSGLVISNHRYDIDWLACWMLSEKLGRLGSDKAMLKSSLRFVPVIGWGWVLGDMIFLSRNWEKDRENLAATMDILLTYFKSFVLAFFEGTRFTKTKYEASVKFAEERNLPLRLKHHLIPRTRGFNCMAQRVKIALKNDPKLTFGLYNFQIALDNDDNSKATLTSVLKGVKTTVHIYVERLDFKDVSVESEEATSDFLYKIYKDKDRLHDYFLTHQKFPGIEKQYKPRIQSLLNWIFWMITIYSTIIYFSYRCLAFGNSFHILIASTLALSAIISIRMLVNSTKVSKSSSYGTKKEEVKQM